MCINKIWLIEGPQRWCWVNVIDRVLDQEACHFVPKALPIVYGEFPSCASREIFRSLRPRLGSGVARTLAMVAVPRCALSAIAQTRICVCSRPEPRSTGLASCRGDRRRAAHRPYGARRRRRAARCRREVGELTCNSSAQRLRADERRCASHPALRHAHGSPQPALSAIRIAMGNPNGYNVVTGLGAVQSRGR
jgi:hypothetical protein